MKLFKYTLLILCVLVISNLYSQNKYCPYEFLNSKNTSNGKMVYFGINKSTNQINKTELEQIFSNDNNILFYKLHANNIIQLEINNNIDAFYIKKILLENNIDFDNSSIRINETELEKYNNFEKTKFENNKKNSSHKPIFIDTGNPEKDKDNFEIQKREWIAKYPDEVASETGRNINDIIQESKIDSSFPKYISTGNPAKDDANYEKAKSEYLKKNNK